MRKATVTYVAPIGGAQDTSIGGVSFHDGKSIEVNSYDNPHLLSKLEGHPLFDVTIGKEDDSPPPKVKRGRPSNIDIAAAKAAAEQAEQEAKVATEKAAAAKSDAEKIANPKETETTRPPTEGKKSDIKAGQAEATGHDFEKDRQAEIARRDAQVRPDNQQTGGQNQVNQGYAQNQQGSLTPGNPPGGQQPQGHDQQGR